MPDEQAWSVEAHLMACRRCRDDVATDLVTSSRETSPVARLVDDVHARLAVLPAPAALRPARRRTQVRSLLGLRQVGYTWACVVVAVLAGAAVLDLVEGSDLLGVDDRQGALAWFAAGGSWVAAMAPLLPVLGVALAQGPTFDPAHEAVAATPTAGLRLVLWRTVGVLTALPVALALEGSHQSGRDEYVDPRVAAAGTALNRLSPTEQRAWIGQVYATRDRCDLATATQLLAPLERS